MRPGEALFHTKVAVCSRYGLSFRDFELLKVWQLNILVDQINKENEEAQASSGSTTAARSKRPPGSVPVMT